MKIVEASFVEQVEAAHREIKHLQVERDRMLRGTRVLEPGYDVLEPGVRGY